MVSPTYQGLKYWNETRGFWSGEEEEEGRSVFSLSVVLARDIRGYVKGLGQRQSNKKGRKVRRESSVGSIGDVKSDCKTAAPSTNGAGHTS